MSGDHGHHEGSDGDEEREATLLGRVIDRGLKIGGLALVAISAVAEYTSHSVSNTLDSLRRAADFGTAKDGVRVPKKSSEGHDIKAVPKPKEDVRISIDELGNRQKAAMSEGGNDGPSMKEYKTTLYDRLINSGYAFAVLNEYKEGHLEDFSITASGKEVPLALTRAALVTAAKRYETDRKQWLSQKAKMEQVGISDPEALAGELDELAAWIKSQFHP